MRKGRKSYKLVAAVLVATLLLGMLPNSLVVHADTQAPSVSNMKVELLDNPYGINTKNPAFSWVMEDESYEEIQTAYRIVVGDTKAEVEGDTAGDIDTGWVNSDESTYVKVPSLESYLKDNSLYFWKVQIKDKDSNASTWSEVKTFSTQVGNKWESTEGVWYEKASGADEDYFLKNGWKDYAVEMDVNISGVALGIIFRAEDNRNSYFWQFRSDNQLICPHYIANGGAASYNKNVKSAVTIPKNEEFRVKIEAIGTTIKTYIKLSDSEEFVLASTHTGMNKFEYGSIGFRTGNSEGGAIDNIDVYKVDADGNKDGESLYTTGFDGTISRFSGCSISDGKLNVPANISGGTYLAASSIDSDVEEALPEYDNFVFMRDEFEINDLSKVEKVITSVTGLSPDNTRQFTFQYYVNGEYVGLGPTRTHDDAETGKEVLYYNSFDITDQVVEGTNAMGAINYTISDKRFLSQTTVFYTNGTSEVISNSAVASYGWKTLDGTAAFGDTKTNSAGSWFTAYANNMDATYYPFGWDKPGFDDQAWVAPAVKKDITDSYMLKPYDSDNVDKHYVKPVEVKKNAAGNYFIDLGQEVLGGFQLDLQNVPADVVLDIRYGEELSGTDTVRYDMRTGNKYREYWTLKEGDQTIENISLYGFRYIEIAGVPDGMELTADNISAVGLYQDFDSEESSLNSSDELLDDIYEFMKYSIEVTNHTVYVDTQTRERGPYEGDAIINALSSYAFEDDYSLARFSNEYLLTNRTWCLEYVYYATLLGWHDYMYTGNKDSLEEYYDIFAAKANEYKRQNSFLDNMSATYGLLSIEGSGSGSGWDNVLVDWPVSNRDGFTHTSNQYNTIMNAIGYGAIVAMADMAEVLGKTTDAAYYNEQANKIKEGMIEYLYNDEIGAYADGMASDGTMINSYSQHATAFSLAYGIYEDEEMRDALVKSLEEDGGIKMSPYASYFLLSGLYNSDAGEIATDYMLETEGIYNWDHMMNDLGATITTESWDPSLKPNMTYSHAWSTTPASQIVQGMFGVQPIDPGFDKFSIKFQPGNVEWAELKTPSIKGEIETSYKCNEDGTFTGVVTIPSNTNAVVSIPDMGNTYADTLSVIGESGVATEMEAERNGEFLTLNLGSGTYTITTPKTARITSEMEKDMVLYLAEIPYAIRVKYIDEADKETVVTSADGVVYEVSDESVAKISGDEVTFVKEGTVKVLVTYTDSRGRKYKSEFEVSSRLPYILDANLEAKDEIACGESDELIFSLETESDKKMMPEDVIYSVDDSSVFSLEDNVLTAKSGQEGKSATVTATFNQNGKYYLDENYDNAKLGMNPYYIETFENADKFSGLSVTDGRLYVTTSKNVWCNSPEATQWEDYIMSGEFQISTVAASVTFRATNTSNFYLWQFTKTGQLKTHVFADKYSSTQGYKMLETIDVSSVIKPNDVNDFEIKVIGDTITTYLNGTAVNVVQNGDLTQGSVGVRTGGSENFYLDNLEVEVPFVEVSKQVKVSEDESEKIVDVELTSEEGFELKEGESTELGFEEITGVVDKIALDDVTYSVKDNSVFTLEGNKLTALEGQGGNSTEVTATYKCNDLSNLSKNFPQENILKDVYYANDYAEKSDLAGLSVNDGKLLVPAGKNVYITQEGASEWDDYVIEGEFETGDTAASITFRVQDTSNYYLWQFMGANANTTSSPLTLKTHVFSGDIGGEGWKYLDDFVDIANVLKVDEKNSFKIVLEGSKITTYLNDQLISTIEDDTLSKGSVGVRTGRSDKAFYLNNLEISNTYLVDTKQFTVLDPVIPIDKSELKSLLSDCEDLKSAAYTPETWKAFELVLVSANRVLEDTEATQEKVDNTVSELATALANLKKADEEIKPDETTKPDDTINSDQDNTAAGDDTDTVIPDTGDTTNATLWVVFALFSMMMAGIMVFKKKKILIS